MKKYILAFIVVVALAAAVPERSVVATSGSTGVIPTALDAGVTLGGANGAATSIRVRVAVGAGNVTSGKLYCFYLPPNASASGVGTGLNVSASTWLRCPQLDLTVPTATELDGGSLRAFAFADLEVLSGYGRVTWVPSALVGTADDAGTNTYTVTIDAWPRGK